MPKKRKSQNRTRTIDKREKGNNNKFDKLMIFTYKIKKNYY